MLASIVKIDRIEKHPNADQLELAHVKGWQCVIRRGEFQENGLAVYCEVDTWVPHSIAPFLSKGKEPKMYEGVLGERLRTIKLRGELSQGLLLQLSVISGMEQNGFDLLDVYQNGSDRVDIELEGLDVTEYLGIQKWHAPVPTALQGEVWPWPTHIPKTDQENIQNIYDEMVALGSVEWVIEEKLDGSSCTIYVRQDGEIGVCSRNWELKDNEVNANNAFILAAKRSGIMDALKKMSPSAAIQAELCGPGIQGNPYRLTNPELFVFDVYWTVEQRYATHSERQYFLYRLGQMAGCEINQVPHLGILKKGCGESDNRLPSLEKLLEIADGPSEVNGGEQFAPVRREGLVFKTRHLVNGRVHSFKAVSNQFLLRQK